MSLADHWSGGDYLGEGWHSVHVEEYSTFEYNTGSPGVEFVLKDRAGKMQKLSFCLVESIQWRLASFARDCGITEDEAKHYEPLQPNSHSALVGRQVQVHIIKGKPDKNGKQYHEIDQWCSIEEPVDNTPVNPSLDRRNLDPDLPLPQRQPSHLPTAGEANAAAAAGDAIPF
jgi:hypothetical protein